MAVYIDDMYKNPIGQFGRMKMSHMAADTTEELLQMVDKIGVQRKWIQDKDKASEHFDISMVYREKAIVAGAIPASMYNLSRAILKRKSPNEKLILTPQNNRHDT